MTILGRPVIISDHGAELGERGDVVLFDPTCYVLGVRQAMSVERDSSAGFTADQTLWRLLLRADGALSWSSAYTPADGTATLSCAVVLGERDT